MLEGRRIYSWAFMPLKQLRLKKKWFGKCHAIHFHINLTFLNESRIANNWFVSIIAVTYAVYFCRRWFCICLIVCVLATSSKYKRNLTKLSGNGRLFVNNCWNVRGVWKFFISQWECITMNVSHNYDWCSNEASKIRPVVSEKHKMTSGLTLIPAWISNYMPGKVWDEITYPFLNFNGCTVEV